MRVLPVFRRTDIPVCSTSRPRGFLDGGASGIYIKNVEITVAIACQAQSRG
ncbi:MAG: hypothetical protein SXA11_04025 [Cyanobacteriota bacterium]|nr:hypothetical protein [Cyanobacteriota bacterium]